MRQPEAVGIRDSGRPTAAIRPPLGRRGPGSLPALAHAECSNP